MPFRRALCSLGLKGHVCFVRCNSHVVLVADAIPKLGVSLENLCNLGFHSVDFLIELVGVFVGHAGIDSVDFLVELRDLGKVGDKSGSLVLGYGVEISDKLLVGIFVLAGVVEVSLVELEGAPFKFFASKREQWAKETSYVYPGPIQYWGPTEVCDQTTKTLQLEQAK